MRKIYYLLILIFSFSVLSAQEKLSKEEKARREKNIQAGNPFARFGYKAKVATLSNGKYLEFHDLDSIVSIGTVRWHADKSIIVGRIVRDTLNPDAQPTGDTAGRWMSPDPLSEEFPSYSPYNFCLNNPMRYVDPTGMAPEDPTPPDDYQISKNGNVTLIKETNDKFDRLFNENKNESVTVRKGLIGQMINPREKDDTGLAYTSVGRQSSVNEKDYFKLFKFASDNALMAEFSLDFFSHKGKDWIELGTYQDRQVSPVANVERSAISKTYHSHSDTPNSVGSERYSMGDDGNGWILPGQRTDFYNTNRYKYPHPNFVYFPISTRLYNVTQQSIDFVKYINKPADLKMKWFKLLFC